MIGQRELHLLGFASGIAAANNGCGEGPLVLQQSPFLSELKNQGVNYQWGATLRPNVNQVDTLANVGYLCQQLALATSHLTRHKKFFLTIGGDHTSAIGTWSGAQDAMKYEGDLGLIWIDAHMDSHTPETSHSGNIHGMPLASLLGHGAAALTQILNTSPKLKPENICLVGVRSFEPEEDALLKKLNVRVILMEEVKQRGLAVALEEAHAIATRGTAGFGLSIDVDGIDPSDAPGTGCLEPEGIAGEDLCLALQKITSDPRLIGAEIVEFNPQLDQHQKTEKLICKLITTFAAGNLRHD